MTVGGSEAIDIAMRAMLDPQDEVLIPQPSYVSYEPCAILANGTPVIIELKEENEFRLTPEELEAAITPKSKSKNGIPRFSAILLQSIKKRVSRNFT